MMWILSLIHSEIVATNSGPDRKQSVMKKRTRYRQRRSRPRKVSFVKKATCIANSDLHWPEQPSCPSKDVTTQDIKESDDKQTHKVHEESKKLDDARLRRKKVETLLQTETCLITSRGSGTQSDSVITNRKRK